MLRTLDGTRFMPRYHRDAELAPRDVVARAIDREMKRRGEPHVCLDITHRPAARVRERFPNIDGALRALRLRPHARADSGRAGGALHVRRRARRRSRGAPRSTGLLALGEVACTGLHGANRLASNSLLEALVGAHHAAEEVRRRARGRRRARRAPEPWRARGTRPPLETVVFDHNWDAVRRVMWDLVGIVRTDQRLAFAARQARAAARGDRARLRAPPAVSPTSIELRNIALVGALIVRCAQRRKESRGLHYNLDHPRRSAAFARPTVLRRVGARRAAAVLAAGACGRPYSRARGSGPRMERDPRHV